MTQRTSSNKAASAGVRIEYNGYTTYPDMMGYDANTLYQYLHADFPTRSFLITATTKTFVAYVLDTFMVSQV